MSSLNQQSILSEVALRTATNKISNSQLRSIALEHGLISLEYLLGIRKPNSESREQFVKGLRLQLNGIYGRNTYDKLIENYIRATIQLIKNLSSEDIDELNCLRNIQYKIPNSKRKVSLVSRKTTYKSNSIPHISLEDYKNIQSNIIKEDKIDTENTIQSETNEDKTKEDNKVLEVDQGPIEENNSSKKLIKSNKYSNRPLPSNGFMKGKLDPNQTKRAKDDREDWKKIRKSRY